MEVSGEKREERRIITMLYENQRWWFM
jgi:hypothetical protein